MWICILNYICALLSIQGSETCLAIFLPALVMGNFMVLNLFLALLLNSFNSEELKSRQDDLEDESRILQLFVRIRVRIIIHVGEFWGFVTWSFIIELPYLLNIKGVLEVYVFFVLGNSHKIYSKSHETYGTDHTTNMHVHFGACVKHTFVLLWYGTVPHNNFYGMYMKVTSMHITGHGFISLPSTLLQYLAKGY